MAYWPSYSKGPPEMAQFPMATHHLGAGICSQSVTMVGDIFREMVPATIIRSDWRGDARKAPLPKRSKSKRLAPAAIISIAQQAHPKVIGPSGLARD